MVYSSALWLHSLLRWAVLFTGVIAWFISIGGASVKRPWGTKDEMWGVLFILSLDMQALVGLGLYVFLSPFTKIAFQNLSVAMTNANLRFWAVEHISGMIIGLAFAHIGRIKVRQASTDLRKQRTAAIFIGFALLAVLLASPWPGKSAGRPLIRF